MSQSTRSQSGNRGQASGGPGGPGGSGGLGPPHGIGHGVSGSGHGGSQGGSSHGGGSAPSSQNAQNLSFVLEARHKVKFEDRPIPELTDDRSVLVQPMWTGICGSDVHYWNEGKIGPYILTKPMVLGHESAGIVLKCGSGVDPKAIKPGDKVAMEPGVPCRFCQRCKGGLYNLCPDMAFAATPPFDGTLANYYVLPDDFLVKLPPNMSLEEGALMEPAAVGVHLVKQGAIKPGDNLVVFGAGPVGLLCMGVAKALGARKIIAVDIQRDRLQFAKQFAATATYESQRISAQKNAENIIRENDLGLGADVVIDASGAEPCIQAGIHVCRPGASYVQGGMGKDDIVFPIMAACTKELRVMGSFRYNEGDYKLAVELTSTGRLPVSKLITRKVKFEDAEQAFHDVHAGKGIKLLIAGPSQPLTGGVGSASAGGSRGLAQRGASGDRDRGHSSSPQRQARSQVQGQGQGQGHDQGRPAGGPGRGPGRGAANTNSPDRR